MVPRVGSEAVASVQGGRTIPSMAPVGRKEYRHDPRTRLADERPFGPRFHTPKWLTAGTLIGSGAVLLWALWPSLVVWAQPLPAFQTLAGGFLSAFALFAVHRLVTGRPVRGMWQMPMGMVVFGVLGILGTNVFFIFAARMIGAGVTNVISYLWPILVLLLGAFLCSRPVSRRQVCGALVAFAGAAVVIGPIDGFPLSPFGIGLAFLSGLSWAAYCLYRIRQVGGPGDAVGAFCGIAGLVCLVLSAYLEPLVVPTPTQALATIGIGLAPMGSANLLWDYGLRHGNTGVLAVLAYTTPVFGVLLLWLTGAGSPGISVLLGAMLIVAGAILGVLSGKSP